MTYWRDLDGFPSQRDDADEYEAQLNQDNHGHSVEYVESLAEELHETANLERAYARGRF